MRFLCVQSLHEWTCFYGPLFILSLIPSFPTLILCSQFTRRIRHFGSRQSHRVRGNAILLCNVNEVSFFLPLLFICYMSSTDNTQTTTRKWRSLRWRDPRPTRRATTPWSLNLPPGLTSVCEGLRTSLEDYSNKVLNNGVSLFSPACSLTKQLSKFPLDPVCRHGCERECLDVPLSLYSTDRQIGR